MSARALAQSQPKQKRKYRRMGGPSQAEKDMVAQFVMDQPKDLSRPQISALATVLNRTPAATKHLIEQAKDNFVAKAGRYVDIHLQTTEMALLNGDPKSLEVAARASQWAIEKISGGGVAIVDKNPSEGAYGGPRIMIGVKIGNADERVSTVSVDAVDASIEEDDAAAE